MSSRFSLLFSIFTLLCLFSLPGLAQEPAERDDPELQEPFQVFDNLYYIGARWVSSWLLVTDQGLIVFDALYDELTDMAIDNIRQLGFDPDDIRYLIVSHAHFDHVGGARRFQEEFAAVTMMTEEHWQMTNEPAVYREYPDSPSFRQQWRNPQSRPYSPAFHDHPGPYTRGAVHTLYSV